MSGKTLDFYFSAEHFSVFRIWAGVVVMCNGGVYHVIDGYVYLGSDVLTAVAHLEEVSGEEAGVVLDAARDSMLYP